MNLVVQGMGASKVLSWRGQRAVSVRCISLRDVQWRCLGGDAYGQSHGIQELLEIKCSFGADDVDLPVQAYEVHLFHSSSHAWFRGTMRSVCVSSIVNIRALLNVKTVHRRVSTKTFLCANESNPRKMMSTVGRGPADCAPCLLPSRSATERRHLLDCHCPHSLDKMPPS